MLITGAATEMYAQVQGYISRKQAAPGTCPVSEKGLLLFDAVALSRASFLLSIFEHDHRISVKD